MSANGKSPSFGPGGGGGGATGLTGFTGGNGFAGKVELSYTSPNAPSVNIMRWLMHVPAGGDTNNGVVFVMNTSGYVATVTVTYTTASGGSLTVVGKSSGGTTLYNSGAQAWAVNGKSVLLGVTLIYTNPFDDTQIGWNMEMETVSIGPSSYQNVAGSLTGTTGIGTVSSFNVNTGGLLTGTSIGHVALQYFQESLDLPVAAAGGYAGELADARFTRICAEQGVASELVGTAGTTPAMGPQPKDKFTNILQQIEDLDRGLLFETRDQLGVGYRTYKSITDQVPAVILDYSRATISPPFQPTQDDQLTRNDITITRTGGSSYRATQTTGPMSTQNPPNGVGDYTYSLTVNASTDAELSAVAAPILALGTVDDYRYPQITVDLVRSEVQVLFGNLTQLRVGDHIRIVNPPSFLTASSIDQLCFGFVKNISAYRYTIQMNCVPASPFNV